MHGCRIRLAYTELRVATPSSEMTTTVCAQQCSAVIYSQQIANQQDYTQAQDNSP